jgi:hypothetical protein
MKTQKQWWWLVRIEFANNKEMMDTRRKVKMNLIVQVWQTTVGYDDDHLDW